MIHLEGYWVPGLSHGTHCTEKAKTRPFLMMSEQLYLGQELLCEEGLDSALPGARPGGKDSFVGRENRPHPRAGSPPSHINSGANTATGIPARCPQGLTLMEGARWALRLAQGVGGELPAQPPRRGQRGSLRVTQSGGRNRTHPALQRGRGGVGRHRGGSAGAPCARTGTKGGDTGMGMGGVPGEGYRIWDGG